MTGAEVLENQARRAAVAAAGFIELGEDTLATQVLTYFLVDAERAGVTRTLALSILVGQLLTVVVTLAPPGALAAMSLELA